MSIERFFTTEVTRLRATERPGRGADVVLDWSTPDEQPVEVWITQLDTEDVRTADTGDRSRWRLSGPADADIAAGDRIRHGDLVLAVVGRPSVPEHPEDGAHHLVCTLKLVEG